MLALDWVGHGHSELVDQDQHYHLDSMVQDVCDLIYRYRKGQVLLVGHSMGCSLAVGVSNTLQNTAPLLLLAPKVVFTEQDKSSMKLLALPLVFFQLFRVLDKWGGIHSPSVKKYLGPQATVTMRQNQLNLNGSTHSLAIKKVLLNCQLANRQGYQACQAPIHVVGGAYDQVSTPHVDLAQLKKWLTLSEDDVVIVPTGHSLMLEAPELINQSLKRFHNMTLKQTSR